MTASAVSSSFSPLSTNKSSSSVVEDPLVRRSVDHPARSEEDPRTEITEASADIHIDDSPLLTFQHLPHILTRGPVGRSLGPVLHKRGIRTWRLSHAPQPPCACVVEEVLVLGGACSEVFSGKQLAKVLRPAVEAQRSMLEALEKSPAPLLQDDEYPFQGAGVLPPLSIHTSVGVPPALGPFLQELKQHLPWSFGSDADHPVHEDLDDNHRVVHDDTILGRNKDDDWMVNLQIEGASAVWAGVEGLARIQEQTGGGRDLVAVGTVCYHGPRTTSLSGAGGTTPAAAPRAHGVVHYPVPSAEMGDLPDPEEPDHAAQALVAAFLDDFDAFLGEYGRRISVLVVEPQWGSSNCGRPWPPKVLREILRRARKGYGILVLCDEIMCGLGRHGCGRSSARRSATATESCIHSEEQAAVFLSRAWDLDPDAVTFGKSIAAGVYPLSGVAFRPGLRAPNDLALVQSHTFAGSSQLALLTAREVLKEVPNWADHVRKLEKSVREILREDFVDEIDENGVPPLVRLRLHGQGLLWGGRIEIADHGASCSSTSRHQLSDVVDLLKSACRREGVWPYFVATGFLLTPPIDVAEDEWREALHRLKRAWRTVVKELIDVV